MSFLQVSPNVASKVTPFGFTSCKAYTPPIVRQSEIGSSFTTTYFIGVSLPGVSSCFVIPVARSESPRPSSNQLDITSTASVIPMVVEQAHRLNRGLLLHSYTPYSLLSLTFIIVSSLCVPFGEPCDASIQMKGTDCQSVAFIVASRYNSLGSDLS